MRWIVGASGALALAVGGLGTAVQANVDPGALACVAESYSDAQRAELNALLPTFDVDSEQSSPTSDAIIGIAGTSIDSCAANLGWAEDPSGNAMIFEFSRLSEKAFRLHGPLTGEELGKLDSALATGDRSELWRAMESQVLVGLTGQPSPTQQRDIMTAGTFLIEIGFADVAKAEQVGLLLGFMALQRYAAREFATLQ